MLRCKYKRCISIRPNKSRWENVNLTIRMENEYTEDKWKFYEIKREVFFKYLKCESEQGKKNMNEIVVRTKVIEYEMCMNMNSW